METLLLATIMQFSFHPQPLHYDGTGQGATPDSTFFLAALNLRSVRRSTKAVNFLFANCEKDEPYINNGRAIRD